MGVIVMWRRWWMKVHWAEVAGVGGGASGRVEQQRERERERFRIGTGGGGGPGTQLHTEMCWCAKDLNRRFFFHSNTAHLILFGGRVCSSLDAKGKNTTKCNNDICEVFQLEHPPLASNRGTHLHTKKSRRE
jgi:hypothetical protein